jgi:hypothetical protein
MQCVWEVNAYCAEQKSPKERNEMEDAVVGVRILLK